MKRVKASRLKTSSGKGIGYFTILWSCDVPDFINQRPAVIRYLLFQKICPDNFICHTPDDGFFILTDNIPHRHMPCTVIDKAYQKIGIVGGVAQICFRHIRQIFSSHRIRNAIIPEIASAKFHSQAFHIL